MQGSEESASEQGLRQRVQSPHLDALCGRSLRLLLEEFRAWTGCTV